MIFNSSFIESFAYHLPNNKISSEEIESKLTPVYKKLNLPFGRLELMSGIKERRYWKSGVRPSEVATAAAIKALETSNINPHQIDILINASVCRDCLEPASASFVHQNLNLRSDCSFFDLSNACLGVLNAIIVVSNMIEKGSIKCGMVVAGENSGPLLFSTIEQLLADSTLTRKSIKKYIANLTIGSGAVAFIITNEELTKNGKKILGGAIRTNTSANQYCLGSGDINNLIMETDSEALLKAGITLASDTWQECKKNLNWKNDTANWVVGHQVGTAHERALLKTLNLEKLKTYSTYDYLGNTGSVALPITLIKLNESKKLQAEDKLALLGIGSGLSSIMLGVSW